MTQSQVTDPDFVAELFSRLRLLAPDYQPEYLAKIEIDIRQDFGGQRLYIAKRGKHLSPEQRQALAVDMLGSLTDAELIEKHKTSRATFYREMKKA
jgi:hypothetical protein